MECAKCGRDGGAMVARCWRVAGVAVPALPPFRSQCVHC